MPSNVEYLFVGVGALGAVLFASYMPTLVIPAGRIYTRGLVPIPIPQSVNEIEGLDTVSLRIVKENGLID